MTHLIYYSQAMNIRAGGPSGYLANLKNGLGVSETPIEFLCENNEKVVRKKRSWYEKLLRSFKKHFVPQAFALEKQKEFEFEIQKYADCQNLYLDEISWQRILTFPDLRTIHTHCVLDAVRIINSLRRAEMTDIKVILTSHAPESIAIEMFNSVNKPFYRQEQLERYFSAWQQIEKFAFENADVIIFPALEAMEPYYQTIPDFGKWISGKDIRFVATGANELQKSPEPKDYRRELNLGNQFTAAYLGRHNEVKGYDILKEAAEKLWNNNEDVSFIIGGMANPNLPAPQNPNWHELGWVNPKEVLATADVFILPNRRTYFDLVLLEVMSAGVPVIASETGGNKAVQKTTESLILYDGSADDLARKVVEFKRLSKAEWQKFGRLNRQAYEKFYTTKIFAQNYVELINKIYKDYKLK